MKAAGIVRNIDELGRIVIPKEIRKRLNIAEGDPIEIFVDGTSVILEKYAESCIFCGEKDGLTAFLEKQVCEKCRRKIAK